MGSVQKRLLLIVCLLLPAVDAGAGDGLNRLGRLWGYGWSDGYHACGPDCHQLGENLPPRSFAEQNLGIARSRSCRKCTRSCGSCESMTPAISTAPANLDQPLSPVAPDDSESPSDVPFSTAVSDLNPQPPLVLPSPELIEQIRPRVVTSRPIRLPSTATH